MTALLHRIARVPRNQLGLARALWWAVRGRTAVAPGDVPLPSVGLDPVMLWTITVLGALEIAVVHVLVSLTWLRWSLFAVGVYGLVAFIAFDRTLRQHPHLLRDGALILRFGHFRSVRIPLDRLTSVRRHVVNTHRKTVEVDEESLALSFMGGTNVELRFEPDAEVDVDGHTCALTRVAFQVDDERAAVALLRSQVALGPPPGHRPERARGGEEGVLSQMLAPSGGGPSGSGAAKPAPATGGGSIPTV